MLSVTDNTLHFIVEFHYADSSYAECRGVYLPWLLKLRNKQ